MFSLFLAQILCKQGLHIMNAFWILMLPLHFIVCGWHSQEEFALCLAKPGAASSCQGKQPLCFREMSVLCPSPVEKPCTMPRPSVSPREGRSPHPYPGGLGGKAERQQAQDIYPAEPSCRDSHNLQNTKSPHLLPLNLLQRHFIIQQ